ncbi:MAG: hypothetical protein ACM3ZA_07615 [Bacillota bacterium]
MTSPQGSLQEGASFQTQLERALKPVLARVRLRHLTAWLWPSLLLALVASGLVLGLSRAFPWYGASVVAAAAGALILAGALVASWLTRPGLAEAARAADRLGLAERTVTALELADQPGEMARLQQQDALQRLQGLDVGRIPMQAERRRWLPVALVALAVAVLAVMPNAMADLAAQQARERAEARRQAEQVARLVTQLDDQLTRAGDQADPRLKETLEALKRLQQELKRARNGEEAQRALARAREELQKQADPSSLASARGLDQLSKALKSASMTDLAGQQLEKGLTKEAAEALRQAAEAMKAGQARLTEAERKQLAERLQQAANAARGDRSLSSALREMAQSLATGQQGAAAQAQAMANLAGAVQAAGSAVSGQATLAGLSQQLSQLQGQMLAMAGGSGGQPGQAGQAGQPGQGGQTGQGGQGDQSGGSGSGQQGSGSGGQSGGGSGSGSGGSGSGGSGAGSGSGSGSGGSGAGSGSGSGDGGQGPQAPLGGGGSLGTSNRPGQTGTYESIYAPSLLGGDGQGSLIGGTVGQQGPEDVVDASGSPAVAGELVPYDQVWADYESLIRDSLERSDLPPAMSEVLRQYFSSLEPGQ